MITHSWYLCGGSWLTEWIQHPQKKYMVYVVWWSAHISFNMYPENWKLWYFFIKPERKIKLKLKVSHKMPKIRRKNLLLASSLLSHKTCRTSLKTNQRTDILLTKPNQWKSQKKQLCFKNEINLPVLMEHRIQLEKSCLVLCSHHFCQSNRVLRIRWQAFMSKS